MGAHIRLRSVLAGVWVYLAVQAAYGAGIIQGRVVKVVDGDTIHVLDSASRLSKIRLDGIDAPERGQPYSDAARKALASMVAGRDVTVRWHKRDRFGRIVGTVYVGDVDACLALVKQGYAWHFKRYEKEQSVEDRVVYSNAEMQARASRIGLWADRNPTPPWVWRDQRRKSGG